MVQVCQDMESHPAIFLWLLPVGSFAFYCHGLVKGPDATASGL